MATTGTRSRIGVLAVVAALAGVAGIALAKDVKLRLQNALKDHAIVGDWNYDDIDGAFRRAKKERKPVCIVFR